MLVENSMTPRKVVVTQFEAPLHMAGDQSLRLFTTKVPSKNHVNSIDFDKSNTNLANTGLRGKMHRTRRNKAATHTSIVHTIPDVNNTKPIVLTLSKEASTVTRNTDNTPMSTALAPAEHEKQKFRTIQASVINMSE